MRLLVQNHHLAFFFLDRPDWCKHSEVEVKVGVISDLFDTALGRANPKPSIPKGSCVTTLNRGLISSLYS